MTNEISLGWRLSRSFSELATIKAVPFIDGRSIQEHFRGQYLHSESTLQLPYGVQHRPFTLDFSELALGRPKMGEDLIDWAGYSALMLNNAGYPAGKIPLLTCCGDELCGYVACSMSLEGNEVVWRDFGWVEDDWNAPEDCKPEERFYFSPFSRQREFRFNPAQYQAFLETLLRKPWLEGPTISTRREAQPYRVPLFAKARGLNFPPLLRLRLAEALTETDPLDLRRYGEVDSDVYNGHSYSFWDSQYKAFTRDPVGCIVKALERDFVMPVSRDAVAEACQRALADG